MESYNCVIVDDSEIDRLGILAVLKNFPRFKVVGVFPSPEKALAILNEIQIDVLFLDVEMPNFSGLELRKRVKEVPACVFITNSPRYAVESFELDVLDYVMKPLNSKRFAKTADKIEAFMNMRNKALLSSDSDEELFFLKNGTEHIRLMGKNIHYLESSRNYTWIVTEKGKELAAYTLKNILEQPVFHSFIRIHKSFAVAPNRIYKILNSQIILENGVQLPVGKMYKENLLGILSNDG